MAATGAEDEIVIEYIRVKERVMRSKKVVVSPKLSVRRGLVLPRTASKFGDTCPCYDSSFLHLFLDLFTRASWQSLGRLERMQHSSPSNVLWLSVVAALATYCNGYATNILAGPTSSGFVSSTWYTGWHATDFPLSNVSWDKYTHIKYAFG